MAVATLVLLAICFLMGGASQEHALRLALVELAALPLLGLALLRAWDRSIWTTRRFAVAILASAAAMPMIQLVPLPLGVWGTVPGREDASLALEIVGLSPAWVPMSVAPDMTWQSFLALLPAAAVFLGVLMTSSSAHRGYVHLIFLAVAASFVLGLAQAVAGDPFYPWPTTYRGSVSGLFANRNHLATLCLVALPLAAAMVGRGARRGVEGRMAFWIGLTMVTMSVVTVAATRSRAGVGLLGPALAFSALIVWTAAGKGRFGAAALSIAGAAGAAVLLVVALGLGPILDRFDSSAPPEARFERWPTVATAAQAYLPIGAGFGSFDKVYRSVETLEEVDATYLNRAHNEYLEAWLEGGWFSVGVLIAFLIWFRRRAWAAWRAPGGAAADMARAASVGILMLLLHSAVEFPLRTVTVMAVLALLAAILEVGIGEAPEPRRRRSRSAA